jgi:lariat debranching enzyme
MTYDPEWLAITRALNPYLSLNQSQIPLPPQTEIDQLISDEKSRIKNEGLLVPEETVGEDGFVKLVWEMGEIEVGRVQKFWPTAPAEGQSGGSACKFPMSPCG